MAVQFVPVRGKEKNIEVLDKQEGRLYFTTDTGKILMDVSNDERIILGGSGASLYYSLCESVVENVDGTYSLPISSLEDQSAKPKEGDLIINNDGAFYKVLNITDEALVCSRLTVSGSGGGGGGGGSSSSDYIKLVKVEGISSGTIFIYGQPAYITLQANNTLGNNITYNIKIINEYAGVLTTSEYQIGDTTYPNNTEVKFDLGSKMKLGTSKITITATADDCGTARSERTGIQTYEMRLDRDNNFNPRMVFNADDSLSIPTQPVGVNIQKTLKLYVDSKLVDSRTNILTSGAAVELTIPAKTLTHGTHKVKIVLSNLAETVFCELDYEIAIVQNGNMTPIIWLGEYTSSIVDHDALSVPYMVYNPEDPNHGEVYYYLNGTKLASTYEVAYSSTAWAYWRVINYIVGNNTLKIETTNGKAEKVFTVKVEQDSRNMNVITTDALLLYDAEGRSNKENASSKISWLSTGSLKTAVEFNNFNWYNNGWITDEDGNTCLRISNGASIRIPLSIMTDRLLPFSYSFEFVFNLRNVQTYSTLITTTVEGEDTDSPRVVKKISSTDGVVIKYYNNMGLCLGTQEGFFSSSATLVSGRYSENQKLHISFVVEKQQENIVDRPLIYMYINGINSGIAEYVKDTDNFNCGSDAIEINSQFCDIDLYKVRVYKRALTAKDVVQNLIADYADPNMYDINMNIIKYENNIPTIDYKLMREYNAKHPSEPLMPYAVVETLDKEHTLPYKKEENGNGVMVNTEFHNPYLDYLYENSLISDDEYLSSCPSYRSEHGFLNVQGTSSQGYPRRNFKSKIKGSSGAYTCVNTYLNGPKKDKTFSKWLMDSPIGANAFTWKADYMDSSRCHNTGFASFVSTLYSKHPIKDYIKDASTEGLRTTVYGFPMMLFHKIGDDDYEFIGLYNYNLDKSCKDNFGFTYKQAGVHSWVKNDLGEYLSYKEACECWEFQHNQGGRCSFKAVPFDETISSTGNTNGLISIINDYEVRYHCDKDAIENAIHGDGANDDEGVEDFSGKDIEYRNNYLKKKYSRINALLEWVSSTDPTAATGNELAEPVQYDNKTYINDTQEYRLAKFTNEFDKHFDKEYCEIYFIMTELLLCYDSRGKNLMLATWGPQVEGGNDIWYPIFYDIDTQLGVNNSGVPYWDYYVEPTAQNIFSTPNSVLWNNLWTCFNINIKKRYESLRSTNLTIEKLNGYYNFDPQVSKSKAMYGGRPIIAINVDEYYKYIDCGIGKGYRDTSNNLTHSTAFFYCLQGTRELQRELFLRNRFNYLDSQWQQGDYSTTGKGQGIEMRYNANELSTTSDKYIYGADLTEEQKQNKIKEGYILTDKYPGHIFDAELTFNITPYLKQYITLYYDEDALPAIKANDGETLKINPPNKNFKGAQTDILTQQLLYIPAAQYVSSFGDVSTKYLNVLFLRNSIRLKELIVGNDTYGYRNDLLNDDSFSIDAAAKTTQGVNKNAKQLLEKIILSNLSSLAKNIDISGSEKLKEFRALGTKITGATFASGVQLNTLHLPNTIKALNLIEPTSLTDIIDKPPIEYTGNTLTTYKPVSITETEYNNAENGFYFVKDGADYIPVNKDTTLFNETQTYYVQNTIQEYKFINTKGLYIEDLTDAKIIDQNSLTNLTTINIIGGQMYYNSYLIAEKAVKIKQQMQKLVSLPDGYSKGLSINLENINWTPYRLVEYGEVPFQVILLDADSYLADGTYYERAENGEYIPSTSAFSPSAVYYYIPYTYVKKTDHYTFIPYQIIDKNTKKLIDTWAKDTLNGYIYEYDKSKDVIDKAPKDLSMIDTFISSYTGPIKENYFTDTSENVGGINVTRKPYMSGNIFVHNEDGEEIDELQLRNHYKVYYPDLNIFVAKAKTSYTAKFIRIETNSQGEEFETEVDVLKQSADSGVVYPNCTEIEPVRLHYKFKGWSLDPKAEKGYGIGDTNNMYPWDDFAKEHPYSSENDTYTFYAIFEEIRYQVGLTRVYRAGATSNSISGAYGVSMRDAYYKIYDSTSDIEPDNDNHHVHYFNSSELLSNRQKYALIGYKRLPEWAGTGSWNSATVEQLEELYFNATDDEILFGFDSKYDTPFEESFTAVQVVRPISVYKDIYGKAELTAGQQYYTFKIDNTTFNKYWISGAYGIAGNFTNVLTIPSKAYYSNKGLIEVSGIASGAVNDYKIIKAVFFEEGSMLTHIGASAFENWTALEQIELPQSLTYIGDRAFAGCSKLLSLTIGDETHKLSIENIGENAFENSGLTNIIIYIKETGFDENKYYTKWAVPAGASITCK